MSKTEITTDGYSTPSGVRLDDSREADLAGAGRSSEKPEIEDPALARTRNVRPGDEDAPEHLLHNLQSADLAPRCRHAHSSGKRCGSPALAGSAYCYFHRKVRKPETKRIMVPVLDEATQIQFCITHALNDFARGRLSRKDLGIYLWALQIAKLNLPKVQEELAEAAKEPAFEDTAAAMDRLLSDHDYKQFADEASRADRAKYDRMKEDGRFDYRNLTEAEENEINPILARLRDDSAHQLEQPQPEYFDLEPEVVETQHAATPEVGYSTPSGVRSATVKEAASAAEKAREQNARSATEVQVEQDFSPASPHHNNAALAAEEKAPDFSPVNKVNEKGPQPRTFRRR